MVGAPAETDYIPIMRCPFCSSEDTQVKDSRQAEDNSAVRRRRQCGSCAGRFTTFERVQLRDLMVLKKSGRRTPFDRDKLARSVLIALQKRPVEPERTEQMISGVVRQLVTPLFIKTLKRPKTLVLSLRKKNYLPKRMISFAS